MKQDCAALTREIWAAWPEALVAREVLEHASACDACRAELEALRSLCRASSTEEGRPLAWSKALPSSLWPHLTASTRKALAKTLQPSRPLLWAPALALAAAAFLFLLRRKPALPPALAPDELAAPVRSVEELGMLEHLDLLENWELAVKLDAERGKFL